MNARAVTPIVLAGDHVRLEPLTAGHAEALAVAAGGDRSSFGLTLVPEPTAASAAAYIEAALGEQAAGRALPFATIDASTGTVVGSTRFLAIEWWTWDPDVPRPGPEVVEIGSTWLSAPAQRTAINTEAKLLMLGHAFDIWGAVRVFLKTDAVNHRSRAAIERLGATFEGVLRRTTPAFRGGIRQGFARDSAYYSIVDDEWPGVRDRLQKRLADRVRDQRLDRVQDSSG